MTKKQKKNKVDQAAMKASEPEIPDVPVEELPGIDYNQPSSS